MKKRDSNYELMRIISMFLIVLYHTIVHGMAIDNAQVPNVKIILEIIEMVTVVHVNSFILVTGYYQLNSKMKLVKVFELLGLCILYKFIIMTGLNICNLTNYSLADYFIQLNPLVAGGYWFIKCYIMLHLFIPFINKFIKVLDRKEYKILIVLMILVFALFPSITNGLAYESTGFTFMHFVMMYMIGAYYRKYGINWKEDIIRVRIKLIGIIIVSFSINYLIYKLSGRIVGINILLDRIYSTINMYHVAYNNIFVLIASISYFLFFKTLSIESKVINRLSLSVFGVYLIHDCDILRNFLYKWLGIYDIGIYSYKYVFYVIIVALDIFIVCLLIERIRYILFSVIRNSTWYSRFKNRINSLIEL